MLLRSTVFVLGVVLTAASARADQRRPLLALDWQGTHLEATELGRTTTSLQLLGRDGRVWNVPTSDARSARTLPQAFHGYSTSEVREQLTRELGKSFEITGTGHYLVAHPAGQKDAWSKRFEDLYRHFIHYFSVRGFKPREPEFPLVAIVWRNQQDFLRYAQSDGAKIGTNVLGYYSQMSNRITLFDIGAGSGSSQAWQQNADTIIHEATHQTAYNTGVHRRFAGNPRWVSEGLGTMFEAPGVWKAEDNRRPEDRINRGRLDQFRHLLPQRKVGLIAEMISSDRLFETDANMAYCNAWALSFFLVETQQRNYAEYLRKTAARPAFQNYSGSDRLGDFTSVFGTNLGLLETHFLRYMSELK